MKSLEEFLSPKYVIIASMMTILISTIPLVTRIYYFNFNPPIIYQTSPYQNNASIYVAQIVQRSSENLKECNSSVELLSRNWENDVQLYYPKSIFRIFSPFNETSKSEYLYKTYYNNSINLAQNYISWIFEAFHDFYAGSDCRWFVYTSENSFVHIPKSSYLFQRLEISSNPLNEFLLKGHAVEEDSRGEQNNKQFTLIEKSGYILSRFAVGKILNDSEYYKNKMIEDKINDSSVFTSYIINKENINMSAISTEEFEGLQMSPISQKILFNRKFEELPTCDNKVKLNNYSNVAFMSIDICDSQSLSHRYVMTSNLPTNLMGSVEKSKIVLCKKN